MAIIGKIREKSILLVIIIGIALLAFIVGDWISTRGVGNEGEYGVGHVFGEKIDQVQYDAINKKFGKYGDNFVWDYYVDSVIMNNEYDELGITVSDKEFESYLRGDTTKGFVLKNISVSSAEKGNLLNEIRGLAERTQGKLYGNIYYLSNVLQSNRQNDSLTVSLISQIKKNKEEWNLVKLLYLDSRKKEKYLDIISQGIYVTSVEAEDDYNGKENKKSIRYVFKPTNSIKDSEIKFKESDLIKYYVDHKYEGKYQNDKAYRKVKYFSLSDAPSGSDSIQYFGDFDSMFQEFSVAENDTIYANSKSELSMNFFSGYSTIFPENMKDAERWPQYPSNLDSAFKNAKIGDIIGPYKCTDQTNGLLESSIHRQPSLVGRKYYGLSKVIGKTPSRIKARQILVRLNPGDDTSMVEQNANTYLVELSNAADRDAKFLELKEKSADNVGEYDNLTEAFLISPGQNNQFFGGVEISEFCTNAPIGSIKLIQTPLGYHIVEILDRDAFDLAKVASIYKEFKPSEETRLSKETEAGQILNSLYNKIKSLSSQEQVRTYFDSIVDAGSYEIKDVTFEDNNVKNPSNITNEALGNKLIGVAYDKNPKVGSLVGQAILDYDTYVIGMLYEVRKKGTPSYEEIKSEIKKDFLVAKKNEIIIKNLSGKTLDELGLSESVKGGDITFENKPDPGSNKIRLDDNEITGALFSNNGPKEKQITKPLAGSTGVYVITVDGATNAPVKKSLKVEKTVLNKSEMRNIKGTIYNSAFINGLYERANVIDNRKLLNLQIRN